jgi:hypothetical protein
MRGSLPVVVQPATDQRGRPGACSRYESDSAGVLACGASEAYQQARLPAPSARASHPRCRQSGTPS